MPTVLRIGPYRFFFYSNEVGEPPHIHVQRDNAVAKFWLEPITVSSSKHFSAQELRDIGKHIAQHQPHILEAWHGYFTDKQ
ncbi:MAG: hypothetical protein CO158_07090 [Piscirickettsiaceae bacterium CG_4_9_14_3_um_filter_43_564]|nr:DUF4160 domain-containing protein [Thiomicrospira sp.]OIP96268.1 MAG: hypothetical protein AUK56_02555 [Thiomicrospira sp. CG2_30_44_34]PIQ04304.1 MAG: hypothetical protein COW74_05360 [Piscirickettsiaceae bacterium CG18_big_fil_WC_8_21_14_2_50_44_103]PIU37785.1 MAG: hypothetical protein COT01_09995 [Piscirickettsiaceae bacterium CG07_land_8_20_14_0_80_44_28]PIW58061.1 MAG: hypothetical protein COW14_02845 [Piscirickettsiaceae bacterium CG12_big_fil_rev_8_21_14_0_65_44_934]PIW77593.1 MAG: h